MRFLLLCVLLALCPLNSTAGEARAFELVAPSVRMVERKGEMVRIDWTGLVVNQSEKSWNGRLIIVFLDQNQRETARARGEDFVLRPHKQVIATGSTERPAKEWDASQNVKILVDLWHHEEL